MAGTAQEETDLNAKAAMERLVKNDGSPFLNYSFDSQYFNSRRLYIEFLRNNKGMEAEAAKEFEDYTNTKLHQFVPPERHDRLRLIFTKLAELESFDIDYNNPSYKPPNFPKRLRELKTFNRLLKKSPDDFKYIFEYAENSSTFQNVLYSFGRMKALMSEFKNRMDPVLLDAIIANSLADYFPSNVFTVKTALSMASLL